jgi:catechol 2,3-dioxygenase-like lactoylglutathione lyase family enzyme
MFMDTKAYSGIGVRDLDLARAFYSGSLGFEVDDIDQAVDELAARGMTW